MRSYLWTPLNELDIIETNQIERGFPAVPLITKTKETIKVRRKSWEYSNGKGKKRIFFSSTPKWGLLYDGCWWFCDQLLLPLRSDPLVGHPSWVISAFNSEEEDISIFWASADRERQMKWWRIRNYKIQRVSSTNLSGSCWFNQIKRYLLVDSIMKSVKYMNLVLQFLLLKRIIII